MSAPTKPVSLPELLRQSAKLANSWREEKMARRLKALDARHQPPARWYGSDPRCACGFPWPCPDSVILNGGEVKRG